MTVAFMVLAIAACIGWTLNARMLRRALYKAWAEIDALENLSPFTPVDYQRALTDLERRFLATHGTHAEDIDVAIRRGILPCSDPLVEEWIELKTRVPYVRVEGQ